MVVMVAALVMTVTGGNTAFTMLGTFCSMLWLLSGVCTADNAGRTHRCKVTMQYKRYNTAFEGLKAHNI
jgi:hypothetical protein